MDTTLKDFLNEINQIAPPKDKGNKSDCPWQECYDEGSGYVYYWNVVTDEVTWNVPQAYRLRKDSHKETSKSSPYASSQALCRKKEIPSSLEIGKVEDEQKVSSSSSRLSEDGSVTDKGDFSPGVEDERRETKLLHEYDSSESANECDHNREISTDKVKPLFSPNAWNEDLNLSEDENDEIGILTKIKNRAKVLKQLGGEIPPDVQDLVEESLNVNDVSKNKGFQKKRELTGFSLVAGYGNSDDEEEEDDLIGIPIADTLQDGKKTVGISEAPLAAKTNSDSKQFLKNEKESYKTNLSFVESKTFQRKKRIGIEFTTRKVESLNCDSSTAGDELSNDLEKFEKRYISETKDTKKEYPGFKRGGVLFVKSETLNPTVNEALAVTETENQSHEAVYENNKEGVQKDKKKILSEIEEIQRTLAEKLGFLSEGREPVSAVQALYIQMETLTAALKADCLSPKYLLDWLNGTCSELIKLEQSAAPSGWSLQWDRINKRYFYYNQQTGESQWEYPQPDVMRNDEAMDISTTPPPPPDEQPLEMPPPPLIVPPPPPTISRKSPSPPPPPNISDMPGVTSNLDPPKMLISNKSADFEEPLPPGVDFSEIAQNTPVTPSSADKLTTNKENDMLGQELNFFYSDIAALEVQANSAIADSLKTATPADENFSALNVNKEEPPKKKKKKVKIAQGLSLKKKGVSELVEKWRNVQKDLND